IASVWAGIYTLGGAVSGVLSAIELANVPGVSTQARLLNETMGLGETVGELAFAATGGSGSQGTSARANGTGSSGESAGGTAAGSESGGGPAGAGAGQTAAGGSANSAGDPSVARVADAYDTVLGTMGNIASFDEAMNAVRPFDNQWRDVLGEISSLNTAVDVFREAGNFQDNSAAALDAYNRGD